MSNNNSNSNTSDGEVDDSRKKRVNSQSEREAFKKVRSSEQTDDKPDANDQNSKEKNDEMMEDKSEGNARTRDRERSGDQSMKTRQTKNLKSDKRPRKGEANRVWDLESALLYLVQSGDSGDKNSPKNSSKKKVSEQKFKEDGDKNSPKNNSKKNIAGEKFKVNGDKPKSIEVSVHADDYETNDSGDGQESVNNPKLTNTNKTDNENSLVREYLTKEEISWITFRPAHAGDASTIAQWYRRQRSENLRNRSQRQKSRSSSSNEKENIKEEVERDVEEPEIDIKPSRSSSSNDEVGCFSCRLNSSNNDDTNDDSIDNQKNFNSSDDADDEEDGLPSSLLQLEHWLAEGLGDENTCPFVHGLLAYVNRHSKEGTHDPELVDEMNAPVPKASNHIDGYSGCNQNKNRLAAVVLMSLSWAFGKRNLRIEWISFDSSILENKEEGSSLRQKVWLRIHMLSAMTACQAISVDDDVLMSTSAKQHPSTTQTASMPLEEDNNGAPQESGSKKSGPCNNQTSPASGNQLEPNAE